MHAASLIGLVALTGIAGVSNARVIVEDFDGADFNPELNFDFGTDTDFTGGGDTHDHIDGVLWMYADLATVTVNSLLPGEWIESVEVTWTDFCGVGCTALELFGDSDNALFDNNLVGSQETVLGTVDDLGEPITHFTLSSFEGRFEMVTVNIVPNASSMALFGVGGLLIARRRR